MAIQAQGNQAQAVEQAETARKKFNKFFGWLGAIGGGLSLLVGILFHFNLSPIPIPRWVGGVIIGLWTVGPPVFFWVDWVNFCDYLPVAGDDKRRDIAKHTHDLSRNIWLALLAMLAILFNLRLTTS